MFGDEALDGLGVGVHHLDPLGQILDTLEVLGSQGVAAQSLADHVGELHGFGRFHYHHGYTQFPVLPGYLDAVCGVRVDHGAVALPDVADRRQPVGMGAAAGDEAELGTKNVGRSREEQHIQHLLIQSAPSIADDA